MTRTEQAERQLLADLVRQQLGDAAAADFELKILADGSRRIKALHGTACYPGPNWAERFGAHLRRGFFSPPAQPPAVARQPAPASGGTGF